MLSYPRIVEHSYTMFTLTHVGVFCKFQSGASNLCWVKSIILLPQTDPEMPNHNGQFYKHFHTHLFNILPLSQLTTTIDNFTQLKKN